MKTAFTDIGWDDYTLAQHDKSFLKKVNNLIKNVQRTPFEGLGKPEPLKGDLAGWWSRRITGEHRLVYRIQGVGTDQVMEIAACRYHY